MNVIIESLQLINWKMLAVVVVLYCPAAFGLSYSIAETNDPRAVKIFNNLLAIYLGVLMLFQLYWDDVFQKITNAHSASFAFIIVTVCTGCYLILEFFARIAWNYHARKINEQVDNE